MPPAVSVQTALLAWCAAMGLVSLVLMAFDKEMARLGRPRVSERTLHAVAAIGGFGGVIAGAWLFRHKTSKLRFWPVVLLSAAAWGAGIWLLARIQTF